MKNSFLKNFIIIFIITVIAFTVLFFLKPFLDFCLNSDKKTESFQVSAGAVKKIALKLKWKHQFQFAGYYAALEKGLYKKSGLDVTLIEPEADDDLVTDVIELKAQFAIGTSTLMLDHAAGKPVVAVAPIFQHSPTVLIALEKSASKPEDLIGKKLMIEAQSADIITYLQRFSVPLSKCIIYPHAYSPQPLIKGEIDAITAYLTDEPFLLERAGVGYRIFSPAEAGIDFYGDTLFTSRDYLKKEPETVEKFRRASIEGWIYAFNNTYEIIDLIFNKYSNRHSIEHLKFEAEQMKKYVIPEVVQIGYSKNERWSQIAEIYKKQHMIDENYSLDGFLYEEISKIRVVYNFWLLIPAFAVILIAGALAFFFYKLNLKLKAEIAGRKAGEESLSRSEERYRILVENNPMPIVITDIKTGEIKFINCIFENMFGVKKEFIAGRDFDIFYENIEIRREIYDTINNYGFLKDYIAPFKGISGNKRWMSLSAGIIEYEGRSAVIFILNDISDKIRRDEELKKLDRIKERFLKITANDLRSAIGTLQSILDYLIKNYDVLKAPEKMDFLYSLKNCADSTYALLMNLVEWTLNAAGDLKPLPVKIKVESVVKEIFELFGARAAHKRIEFDSNICGDAFVYCDEKMFNTILRNIVSNAVKFSVAGGLIRAGAWKREDGMIELSISDNGADISHGGLDKLFNIDTVFGAGRAEGERGSDIGLVLSQELAVKNGGQLILKNMDGGGVIALIILPAADIS